MIALLRCRRAALAVKTGWQSWGWHFSAEAGLAALQAGPFVLEIVYGG